MPPVVGVSVQTKHVISDEAVVGEWLETAVRKVLEEAGEDCDAGEARYDRSWTKVDGQPASLPSPAAAATEKKRKPDGEPRTKDAKKKDTKAYRPQAEIRKLFPVRPAPATADAAPAGAPTAAAAAPASVGRAAAAAQVAPAATAAAATAKPSSAARVSDPTAKPTAAEWQIILDEPGAPEAPASKTAAPEPAVEPAAPAAPAVEPAVEPAAPAPDVPAVSPTVVPMPAAGTKPSCPIIPESDEEEEDPEKAPPPSDGKSRRRFSITDPRANYTVS